MNASLKILPAGANCRKAFELAGLMVNPGRGLHPIRIEIAPPPILPLQLVDPMAQDGDFGLDGEYRFNVMRATQLDQPRRQAFGARKRIRRFRKPLLLLFVARLESMHVRPLPPPPIVASLCEMMRQFSETDAIYTAVAPL